MHMMELGSKVIPHPDVVSTEMENKEAVLLHLKTKKYYSLNETGLRIWQMLGEGSTPMQISERLQGEFNISSEKAEDSVMTILRELANEQLIEVESA